MDLRGGQEDVACFVGPVEGYGRGKGNEECVKGYEGLVSAEPVTEAGPTIVSIGMLIQVEI